MDQTHIFKINELKCSETGENYAPQVYIGGADENAHRSMWFAPYPGISHDEVDALIEHMQRVLAPCQVRISPRT